jgi:hypothetical protein
MKQAVDFEQCLMTRKTIHYTDEKERFHDVRQEG